MGSRYARPNLLVSLFHSREAAMVACQKQKHREELLYAMDSLLDACQNTRGLGQSTALAAAARGNDDLRIVATDSSVEPSDWQEPSYFDR